MSTFSYCDTIYHQMWHIVSVVFETYLNPNFANSIFALCLYFIYILSKKSFSRWKSLLFVCCKSYALWINVGILLQFVSQCFPKGVPRTPRGPWSIFMGSTEGLWQFIYIIRKITSENFKNFWRLAQPLFFNFFSLNYIQFRRHFATFSQYKWLIFGRRGENIQPQ